MSAAGRLYPLAIAAVLLLAAAPPVADPVQALAGRYSQHFRNGLIDGTSYWSDDVLEIVPVDPRHAYVRADTNFFNGHVCGISGIATAEGEALVYRDPSPPDAMGERCVLTVRRDGAKLAFTDYDGGCKSYCGARGSLLSASLPWASRRRISYLARLKRSDLYRDAITTWRTGRPAQ